MLCHEGIRLLPAEPAHKQLLYGWQHSGDYPYFFGNDRPLTMDEIQALPGEFFVAVMEQDPNHILGMAVVSDYHEINRNATMHLLVVNEAQRKKVGSVIIQTLANHLFNMLNLHKIKFEIPADNVPAVQGAERLGWRKEGTRQHEVYYGGSFHDVVDYAILKGPFNKLYKEQFEVSGKASAVGAA
jgi:RimJ/RimL family protein N-acetyltransferase